MLSDNTEGWGGVGGSGSGEVQEGRDMYTYG